MWIRVKSDNTPFVNIDKWAPGTRVHSTMLRGRGRAMISSLVMFAAVVVWGLAPRLAVQDYVA